MENNLAIEVEHSTFRYPSEWDPRKGESETKGGYLEGSIRLPHFDDECTITLSTTCADLKNENVSEQHGFHPNMIHLVPWKLKGNGRDKNREAVPDISHWKLELLVRKIGGKSKLFVRNQPTDVDLSRSIPEEDYLFDLPDHNKIILGGRGRNNLKLVILRPKTNKRSSDTDISFGRILEQRIVDEEDRRVLTDKFDTNKSSAADEVKIRVDFKTKGSMTTVISDKIVDKTSKEQGSLDIKYVHPSVSCSMGKRTILVVSDQPAKGVIPVFQLFDESGERRQDQEHLLHQPSPENIFHDNQLITRFQSPAQPRLNEILQLNLMFHLRLTRETGPDSNKSVEFRYTEHVQDQCALCQVDVIDGVLHTSTQPAHTGPGRKRRKIESPRTSEEENKICKTDQTASAAANDDIPGNGNPLHTPVEPLGEIDLDALWTVIPENLETSDFDISASASTTLNTPEHKEEHQYATFPAVTESLPDQIFTDGCNPKLSIKSELEGKYSTGTQLSRRNIEPREDQSMRKKFSQFFRKYFIKSQHESPSTDQHLTDTLKNISGQVLMFVVTIFIISLVCPVTTQQYGMIFMAFLIAIVLSLFDE